jgi:hypothetical protein
MQWRRLPQLAAIFLVPILVVVASRAVLAPPDRPPVSPVTITVPAAPSSAAVPSSTSPTPAGGGRTAIPAPVGPSVVERLPPAAATGSRTTGDGRR